MPECSRKHSGIFVFGALIRQGRLWTACLATGIMRQVFFKAVKQGQKLSHPYSTMDFCVEIAVELEQLERVFDSIKGPCVHFSFEA